MFTEKNKKINRLTLKHVLFLITYTIALIWIMLHLNEVFDTVSMIIGMLRPFIYGIMMAFVFNIPMKFFLKKLPDNLGRWKKALAAVCSLYEKKCRRALRDTSLHPPFGISHHTCRYDCSYIHRYWHSGPVCPRFLYLPGDLKSHPDAHTDRAEKGYSS